jgi:hypothetical protein
MPSSNVQDRIAQLEKLVISLTSTLNTVTRTESVSSDNSIAPAETLAATGIQEPIKEIYRNGSLEPSSNLANSFGRITLDNAETSYVDGAHWTSILDSVCPPKIPPPHQQNTNMELSRSRNSKTISEMTNFLIPAKHT